MCVPCSTPGLPYDSVAEWSPSVGPAAAGLDAEDLDAAIGEEAVEDADRVRAAADAGEHGVRQAAGFREHLRARFAADDGLKLPHEIRIRMRADRRAEQVVRADRVRHPVANRLVDRGAQRAVAGLHGDDGRAEPAHAVDVRRLPRDVDLAHVDGARQADARAGRGRRDAVLAGARLGDDALRAERLREQRLADAVVDLVRARVRQVLALEPDLGAPALAQASARASAPSAGRPSS